MISQQREIQIKYLILLFSLPILISGCSEFAGIRDHTGILERWAEPSASNGYIGDLIVDPITGTSITYDEIKQKASANCSSKGGLKDEPRQSSQGVLDKSGSLTGTWKYQCNGISQYSTPVNNPPQVNVPSSKQSVSIDQAKQQCKDLGFKVGTEKFGNCVLELAK